MEDHPCCPRCGGSSWTSWTWSHPLLLFWMLFPVLAVNELLLGQRLPRRLLLCRSCDEPLAQRQYVPCPHCGVLHPGMIWSYGNAFGNWFGYGCPHCARSIPCLWNVASIAVLASTAPLWWMPARRWRAAAVARQVERARAKLGDRLPQAPGRRRWLLVGVLGFGGGLWVSTTLFASLRSGVDPSTSLRIALRMLPFCLLAGGVWGLLMALVMGRRPS